MVFKMNIKMSVQNIFLLLAILQPTQQQLLPPLDKNLFENQNYDQETQKDPIVGMGLGLPGLRAASVIPRANLGAMNSLAQAYALALKARADAQHKIIDNQLRYELATAKARMPGLPGLPRLPLTPRFKLPGSPMLGSPQQNEFDDEFANEPTNSFDHDQEGEFGVDHFSEDLRTLLNGDDLFDSNLDRRHLYDYDLPESGREDDETHDAKTFRRDMERLGVPTHGIFRRDVEGGRIPTDQIIPEDLKKLSIPTHDIFRRDVEGGRIPTDRIVPENLKKLSIPTRGIFRRDVEGGRIPTDQIIPEDLKKLSIPTHGIFRTDVEGGRIPTDQIVPEDFKKLSTPTNRDDGEVQCVLNREQGKKDFDVDINEDKGGSKKTIEVSNMGNTLKSFYEQELNGLKFKALKNPSLYSRNAIIDRDREKDDIDPNKPKVEHKISARYADMHNMKRDEELFIWSLNNFNAGNNFMRDVENQNPSDEVFLITSDRNFWDNHKIFFGRSLQSSGNPVIYLGKETRFEVEPNSGFESSNPGNFDQSQMKETILHPKFSSINEGIGERANEHKVFEEQPISEFDPNNPKISMTPRHFFTKGKHPLFHPIFNKKDKHLGGNSGSHFNQGFSHFESGNNFHPQESNHFIKLLPGQMTIPNQQLHDQQFNKDKLIPTHVTINNHHNTFTNAINTNGDLKIAQGGGSIAESQATSTNVNQFLGPKTHHHQFHRSSTPNNDPNSSFTNAINTNGDLKISQGGGCIAESQASSTNVNQFLGPKTNHHQILRSSTPNNDPKSPQNIFPNNEFNNNNQNLYINNSAQIMNNPNDQKEELLTSPYLLRFPYEKVAFHKRNSQHLLRKRSLPLVRLIADPNTKLDMPKTIENVGTIAKKSFEDRRAPMYHVKNMLGSTKDAFLSTLKIAPQNVIIPSRYRIIDTNHEIVMKPGDIQAIKDEARAAVENELKSNQILGSRVTERPVLKLPTMKEFFDKLRLKNDIFAKPKIDEDIFRKAAFTTTKKRSSIPDQPEEDPFNFLGTFQKVGSVIRDSIKSSHETVSHINNVAHSARKAVTTSQFALPKILLPYTTAPVVKSTLFDDNLMMISPRFLDVTEDVHHQDHPNGHVRMGEIMDAFGMSNPGDDKIGLSRIIIQKKKENPLLQSRFGEEESLSSPKIPREYYVISESIDDPNNVESIAVETVRSLHDIMESIGVSSIKDFLEEMKRVFFTLQNAKIEPRIREDKVDDEEEELDQFLRGLFKKNEAPVMKSRMGDQPEIVGAGMNLPPNLFKPFMNQPSRSELEDYFREHGDDLDDINLPESNDEVQQFLKLTGLVSSINPDVYMRLFNESLSIDDNATVVNPAELFKSVEKEDILKSEDKGASLKDAIDEEDRRTIMKLHKKLLKPYMGKIKVKEGEGMDYEDYGQPYQGYFEGFGQDDDDGGIL